MRNLKMTIVAVCAAYAHAQQIKPAGPLEFEVASVRQFQGPHVPHGVSLNVSHGRVSVDAGSLRQLVALAYGVQRAMVEGGPDWSGGDEFNIVAKAENEGASYSEIQEMLQTLLADRFKLVARRETKELPGYALELVKNGPKLKVAKKEEVTAFTAVTNGLVFQKMPIAGLVSYLANLAGSPVQDLTGLAEFYDFNLDLTPSASVQSEPRGNAPPILNRFVRVSIAVEEQLGLKLEARKVQAEVVVIDHAEHPSAN
jgi:uncharacterized protein (TIGR03435 family)